MSQDSIALANQFGASGNAQAGLAMLDRMGKTGDAAALAELAVWYLRGNWVARDLGQARVLLREAVRIGHVDAALMEIAMTANGSGSAPDWRGAVNLLITAAKGDPVARHQLDLLGRMAIDSEGRPIVLPTAEQISDHPAIRVFPGLCSAPELEHIAQQAVGGLQPAVTVDPRTGKFFSNPIRRCEESAIGPTQETLVVQAVLKRIAHATGSAVDQGEPLTVLRYQPGQEYREHLDILPGTDNQRIKTAILYLNHGYSGGRTRFTTLGLDIDAHAGDLLVFDNVDGDGAPLVTSRHCGMPVTSGIKWIATRWIRARPINPWRLSEDARAAQSANS